MEFHFFHISFQACHPNSMFEACCYLPSEEVSFVRDFLLPALKTTHPYLNILLFDHNKDDVVKWVTDIYSDPTLKSQVWGTAVKPFHLFISHPCKIHWYTGPQLANVFHSYQKHPEIPLLNTEACRCPVAVGGVWENGEAYAFDIIGGFDHFFFVLNDSFFHVEI